MRCQALSSQGKRCRKGGAKSVHYHGENELYGWYHDEGQPNCPARVLVYLCKLHRVDATLTDREKEEEKEAVKRERIQRKKGR